MAKTTITFEVDADCLESFSDTYIAQLWHVSQANPAPFGDAVACNFAECVGREIIRRWLNGMPPELWAHQARHVHSAARIRDAAERHGGKEVEATFHALDTMLCGVGALADHATGGNCVGDFAAWMVGPSFAHVQCGGGAT